MYHPSPKSWSRNYSPTNTRRLRNLIRSKRIVVDTERGAVTWPNGKPVHTRPNFWGYPRFQIRITRKDGKRVTNWFFVHKAVMIADGLKLKKHHEISHKDHSRANCRRDNLEYIHRKDNMNLKAATEIEPAL